MLKEKLESAIGLLRTNQFDQAELEFNEILKRWPEQGDALHYLGLLKHRCGEPALGVELLRRAVIALPGEPGPWNNLGNILVMDQHYDDAEKAYNKCLEIQPNFLDALSNLSTIYSKRGWHQKAEALCRQAIAAKPDFGQAWYNLSVALLAQNRIDDGLTASSHAILLWPKHLQARESVIRALIYLGRLDEAARLYREWLAVDPDNPMVQHLLAACTGEATPTRASDGYIEQAFDAYSATFDASLAGLEYRAPNLVAGILAELTGAPNKQFRIADLGCGTGLCGPIVAGWSSKLVGCDLSSGMLDKARRRRVYDELVHMELVKFLQTGTRPAYEILLCADTFCYFGSLDEAFDSAAQALVAGGWLIFTVEALMDDSVEPHHLQPHGRYSHRRDYLEESLRRSGFTPKITRQEALRKEAGNPVRGWLVAAQSRQN